MTRKTRKRFPRRKARLGHSTGLGEWPDSFTMFDKFWASSLTEVKQCVSATEYEYVGDIAKRTPHQMTPVRVGMLLSWLSKAGEVEFIAQQIPGNEVRFMYRLSARARTQSAPPQSQ